MRMNLILFLVILLSYGSGNNGGGGGGGSFGGGGIVGVHCVGIIDLRESISQLEAHLVNLTSRLRETELRLSKVEHDCKCINTKKDNNNNYKSENQIKSMESQESQLTNPSNHEQPKLSYGNCVLSNGSIVLHSSKWITNCSNCFCDYGVVNCSPVKCPPSASNCKPSSLYFPSATHCCPVCHKKCLRDGKSFEHNDVYLKDCLKCVCHEGNMRCKKMHPVRDCPVLDCPVAKQFKADGECCKYCVDTDFCGNGHNCDPNAVCINLKTGFTCKCNDGYWGDGKMCSDINECNQMGGIGGNLCRDNTKCVNTNGSYSCECLPGFRRRDSLNCIGKCKIALKERNNR